MQVRRAVVGLLVAGLAFAVGGCGSESNAGAEATDITVTAETEPIPDRVAVHQPGRIDTDISPDDLPVWPGPHPSEFLEPSPPSGESGVIAGEQAAVAYVASLDNPDALWNVGGTVQWLVVNALS
ncbi:hypothetical protein M2284_004262 [Rhodococcus sp. LBL1]|nr:hypothetical protein [Rhodococcus sp. LBL1]MDH6684867.1 hypothetical protein [Rhodococcus sp. LBL2]